MPRLKRIKYERLYLPAKGWLENSNWNSTNEFICYGRHGEMATNSREQQEATTLSFQLLQNCLMLINTILIQRDDRPARTLGAAPT
jgi:Tn3 transposase DDE domain-containing protein